MSKFPDTDNITEKTIYSLANNYERCYRCYPHSLEENLVLDDVTLEARELLEDLEMTDSERRIVLAVNDMLASHSHRLLEAFTQWLCEFVDWYEDERGV